MPSQTAYVNLLPLALNEQAEATSGSRVAKTIHNQILPTLHNYMSQNNSELEEQLNTLKDIRTIVAKQEQEVYNLFGVKSVEELNNRVQNEMAPLLNLNNRNLREVLKLVDESYDIGYFLKELQPTMDEALKTVLEKNSSFDTNEELLDEVRITAIDLVNKNLPEGTPKFQVTKKSRSLGSILNNFLIENNQLILSTAIDKSKFRSDVSSRLKDYLKVPNIKVKNDEYNASSTVLITQKNRESYAGWAYSYKNLTLEERQQIKEKILEQCKKIIGSPQCNQKFEEAFNEFPEAQLFANTVTEVVGNLGEIQLGAMIKILLGGKSAVQLQTGALRNELESIQQDNSSFGHKKYLSVDFVLNGVGFQVKNFNEYANRLGLDYLQGKRAINLGLEGTPQKINQQLSLNEELSNILELFFGIQSFNQKYQEDDGTRNLSKYDPVVHMIEATNDEIKNLYSLYPDQILRLSQEIQVMNEGKAVLKGKYYKSFYFSNGVFIPSSKLLDAVIALFNDLRHGNLQEFVLQSSYNGPVAEAYKTDENNTPTYKSIASQTHLRLNYIFLLQNYLSQQNISA